MRLHLKLSPNTSLVPFAYQRFLVGAFHKWLGENELHDGLSLYSLSWLSDGKVFRNALRFEQGSRWFISSPDEALLRKLFSGIQEDPVVAFGMHVREVLIQETPDFGPERRFVVNSPVLVKKPVTEGHAHLSFRNEEAGEILTQILQHKLCKAELPSKGVSVAFDAASPGAKMKLVTYKEIGNKANFCPVIVKGKPDQVAFAWDVGVGHSTGIGFGALN